MAIYVISDLHGRKDKYDLVLEQLQPKDHLYILGDVIDRGNDGIAILLDIMKRDNVTLLMGNHEKMMIDYLRGKEDHKGSVEERMLHYERWQRNGSQPTKAVYEQLDDSIRKQLRAYLEGLPYVICDLEVNQRIFCLCHAYPSDDCISGILYEKDLSEQACMEIVWNRFVLGQVPNQPRIHVVGHTPTPYYQDVIPFKIYQDLNEDHTSGIIDIDCGLAFQKEEMKVAMLCLDNLNVCYL